MKNRIDTIPRVELWCHMLDGPRMPELCEHPLLNATKELDWQFEAQSIADQVVWWAALPTQNGYAIMPDGLKRFVSTPATDQPQYELKLIGQLRGVSKIDAPEAPAD